MGKKASLSLLSLLPCQSKPFPLSLRSLSPAQQYQERCASLSLPLRPHVRTLRAYLYCGSFFLWLHLNPFTGIQWNLLSFLALLLSHCAVTDSNNQKSVQIKKCPYFRCPLPKDFPLFFTANKPSLDAINRHSIYLCVWAPV